MRNPMDVIGAAARSDDAARYGVGLTVLKALRDEYGVAPNPNRIGFAIPVPDWDLADHPEDAELLGAHGRWRRALGEIDNASRDYWRNVARAALAAADQEDADAG